jgi:flagellar hook-basal body complex protein FliE
MSEIGISQMLAQMRTVASQLGGEEITAGTAPDRAQFSDLLSKAVDAVNESQQLSSDLKARFQLGQDGVDISQVMVASQKASLQFQLMVQVRNKLVTAYQDVMNMQI